MWKTLQVNWNVFSLLENFHEILKTQCNFSSKEKWKNLIHTQKFPPHKKCENSQNFLPLDVPFWEMRLLDQSAMKEGEEEDIIIYSNVNMQKLSPNDQKRSKLLSEHLWREQQHIIKSYCCVPFSCVRMKKKNFHFHTQ